MKNHLRLRYLWLLCPMIALAGQSSDVAKKIQRIESDIQQLHLQLVALKKQLGIAAKKKPHHKSTHLGVKKRDFTAYFGPKVLQASAITTSPTLGTESAFDGSDLLIATSSMNQDFNLLKRRQAYTQQRQRFHSPMGRPQVELTGAMSVGIDAKSQAGGSWTQQTKLAGFEMDVLTEINPKIMGYTTLEYQYDDADRLQVGRAFLTWGDLNRSPWYLTAGQFYAPFGRYAAATITSPMTKTMGRMKDKGLIWGWAPQHGSSQGWRLQSYLGRSDTGKLSQQDKLNHWGLNAIWQGDLSSHVGLTAGLGYTNNMMNASLFKDWLGTDAGTNLYGLAKRYAGLDTYARLTFDAIQWNTEWVSLQHRIATNPVPERPELYHQKPHAMYTELRYNTHRTYPGMLTVGVARAWGVGALDTPKRSYFLTDNMNLWKNTLQSIEWRLDRMAAPAQTNKQIACRFGVFF